jgi:hypothetical protein
METSMRQRVLIAGLAGCLLALGLVLTRAASLDPQTAPSHVVAGLFQTSDDCIACHNNLLTPSGEDVSIGVSWRATMMANSARDPYWQASVRRETIDHAGHAEDIEDECSICHMPMARFQARAAGQKGRVFTHLPIGEAATPEALLAADGVSCTVCHQITSEKFGDKASFTGGFAIDTARATDRSIFGPFTIDRGRTRIMRSASGFLPTEASHIQASELCATCHTLITQAFGPDGAVTGRLPEQVPYLEWKHSGYRTEQSCQSCHMPVVQEPTPISSVLGDAREGLARHVFVGGNFFMLRILNRFRVALGVAALPHELDSAVRRTVEHVQTEAADVSIEQAALTGDRLDVDLSVTNRSGHKLPTAYPSRRVWIHLRVADANGRTVFESGALRPDGSIEGNDNDEDPSRFERHYETIRQPGEVQIYESILADASGAVTTGLLKAVGYAKDNRLLPAGFDKGTAEDDIRVRGGAVSDADFAGGGDRIRYSVDVGSASGPFTVSARLMFQPIAYRWAENLRSYQADEPRRFVGYFESMAASSAETLAATRAATR